MMGAARVPVVPEPESLDLTDYQAAGHRPARGAPGATIRAIPASVNAARED
jgi:hypothetical protein